MALRVRIPHEARTATRKAIPGATATVAFYGGGTAPVYAVSNPSTPWLGAATLPQPLVAGPDGRLPGYVPPGRYTVTLSHGGIVEPWHEWNAMAAGAEPWVVVGFGGGPAFQNSWSLLSFGTWPRFRRTSEGLVVIKGGLAGGTVGATAFTLPAEYRPSLGQIFPATIFGATGRINVNTDGTVVPAAPSISAITYLDNVLYAAV